LPNTAVYIHPDIPLASYLNYAINEVEEKT